MSAQDTDPRDGARTVSSGNPGGSPDSQALTIESGPTLRGAGAHFHSPGTIVSHYEIRSILGRGGMGEVYEGFDLTLKRPVALKAIRAERRLHARSRARFLREAQILSKLDHPHICRIYDYVQGEESDFIVLELIDGILLDAALRRGLDKARKMQIAEQIVKVLAAAHAVGVVHRDLKPTNVMLTADGGVKVLDFGLASSPERDPEPAATPEGSEIGSVPEAEPGRSEAGDAGRPAGFETEAGALVGTLAYMSPEQARSETPGAASDMYAFGLVLQEIYTGNPAYPREIDAPALLEMARNGETLPPTGVPADLAELIRRLKAKAPSNRPTAVEAGDRLRIIREKPKRVARRLIAAGAMVAVVLAGTKYTVDLRRERAIADQRRHQAEDLVGFMLGDLRTKLEPIGKLDILDDIGKKAMGYFAAVPKELLSDDELLSRSMALYQIGEVRLLQDNADLSAALAAFDESLTLSRALAEAEPDSADRQFRLSQSEYWVGYVDWQRNQLDEALTHFRAYLDIAEWLVAKDPDNPDWQLELSYANSNIGSVLEARGELDEALVRYQETLAINLALARRDPANLEWKEQLAEQHNLVGSVQLQLGDLDGAMENFQADLALKKELTAAEPDNFTWLNGLANSHNWVAQVLEDRGQVGDALSHYSEDLALTEKLVEQDETNTRHRYNLGRTREALSRLHSYLGSHAEALAEARSSSGILSSLTARDPSNERWRLGHIAVEANLSTTLMAAGNRSEGERTIRAAVEGLHLPPDPAAGPTELIIVAETLFPLAEIEVPREGPQAFLKAWGSTLDVLRPTASASRNVRLLDPWVRLLVLTGRTDEAAPIIERLEAIGYRNPNYLGFLEKRGLRLDPHRRIARTARPGKWVPRRTTTET